MKPKLLLIASCTDRKSQPVPPALRLRTVRVRVFPDRVVAWVQKLESSDAIRLEAASLYQGEHWSCIKSAAVAARANGFDVETWVLSAGYGLVQEHETLKPYAATFAFRQLDSVTRASSFSLRSSELSGWWSRLATAMPLARGRARTIQALLARHPKAYALVVASPAYLTAARQDIAAAVASHGAPDRVSVLSSGAAAAVDGIGFLVVPVSARLVDRVGGSRMGLHARIARALVEEVGHHSGLERGAVSVRLSNWLKRARPLPKYERSRLSDSEVRGFVSDALRKDATQTRSALLRRLRTTGQACEQKRFGQLYGEVQESHGT